MICCSGSIILSSSYLWHYFYFDFHELESQYKFQRFVQIWKPILVYPKLEIQIYDFHRIIQKSSRIQNKIY